MTAEIWITIVFNALTLIGVGLGMWIKIEHRLTLVETKIDVLSERQLKYNNLQERMARVESSAASAHHRCDTLEEKVDDQHKPKTTRRRVDKTGRGV